MSVELHPVQEKAVCELDNGKILVGDVGSGKSITAAAYYVARESPRDVVVITTAKKRDSGDWEEEFHKFNVGSSWDTTLHGTLIVDSWNNIGNYVDVYGAFFIFDEQRVVGSGAWTKAFYKIAKVNRWILLSATPGDTWLDYVPVFVANGFYKNKTAFVDEHVQWMPRVKFPKVQRYHGGGKLVRLRNQLLVEMPVPRHTTRHLTWVNCSYDTQLLEEVTKKRWNILENRPLRDVAELFRVARRLVNTDASRLVAVRSLMEKHPRLIVFYNFDYELEQLRTLSEGSIGSSRSETSSLSSSSSEVSTTRKSSTSSPSTLDGSRSARNESTSGTGGAEPWSDTQVPTSNASRSRCNACRSDGSHPCFPDCETSRLNTSLLSSHTSPGSSKMTPASPSSSPATPTTSSRSDQSRSVLAKNEAVTDSLTTATLQIAEWNGHKHQAVPTSERWIYLVQYTAGSEGWNCTTTDAMVMYSLTYSYKAWHQAFGRIDRLNTPYLDLYYYALVSKSWIDLAVRKSLTAKKSFNERSSGFKFAKFE